MPKGDGKESLIMPAKKKPDLGRIYLNSGVKKLLIVGLVEKVPEMYDNMQTFLRELQLSSISFTAAMDLKLANVICGLQCHASIHPCCWCEGSAP